VTASEERFARVGEIELCWQSFGDEGHPPLLLIMGLGFQMIHWPDGLCELLADRGFRVIRFDNRDSGRSTILNGAGAPAIGDALRGDLDGVPYTLSDMAADAIGLLDELEIDQAHVAGASLGGMVAQTVAIEHPLRVLSLASISSTTGDRDVGKPNAEGMKALTTVAPSDREGYLESVLAAGALIASPGFPDDEERRRDVAARSFDRGYHPDGTQRQTVAIIASGDRTSRLQKLTVPTVVIHGDADPLIGVSGGQATAGAVADSRLLIIPGMGHDLPEGAWQVIADAIAANAASAAFPESEVGEEAV
jgi:pimeloyl-ACP methyl ester carboxylesterase